MAQTLQSGTSITATTNSSAIDVSSYNHVTVQLRVTNVSGTNPTLDVFMQGSMDNSNWFNLADFYNAGTFPRFSTTGQAQMFLEKFPKYIRARMAVGGTSPSFTVEIILEGK